MRSASANTASMSCSISRIARRPLRPRNIATTRADSSGPSPAIGSSSNKRRGLAASAMASSSRRCSPWLSADAITPARASRPTLASAARAGSPRAGSRRASAQKRNEWPACACTASATLSRAVTSRKSEVIWNERARPSMARRSGRSVVMSWPSKKTLPASGAISPASWPISVVLPAPLGPMMACSSPGASESMMSSEAVMPPNCLRSPSIRNRGSGCRSATADPREQAIDAAAREQHDQQEEGADDDLPVLGDARKALLEQQQRQGAEHRADHRAHAAEHGHDDEIARARPVHDGGADEIGMIGEQHAGEAAQHTGDDEAGELVAKSGEADRAHAPFVRAGALDHQAEARVDQARDQKDRREQEGEAEIVECGLVVEVDHAAEAAAMVDGEAVVAAVAIEAARDVVGHLREGERDHDEVDAAGAQAERADAEREDGRDHQRERPLQEARADAFLGEDTDDVAAEAEEGGVAEAHHAAVAHHQVEADGRDGEYDDAGEHAERKRAAAERAIDRDQGQDHEHRGDHGIARREMPFHRRDAGNRPSGRSTSTAAIST